ncbi:tetratricopeptide repeat protein [Streptomyces aurantiogriseus]|uniref:Tetratricopeptide repeat protein n=1 Tax=Streptomyces aurantiogriseus TaxID=66870 RepID=A0A918FHH7_9ACTN|nr:tetratricopeptide repeat protein [Streptomyces aurantiogriseus]GGR38054.1 hypothetical protein GCM10010251_63190 [Streptomyces aurantiogriseus]
MSRLSREKKREQQQAGRPAAVVAPLDVHVPGGGTATIGGVPVVAADGQEIQHAVLGHLHRIALATGHPVVATVHDERIGYVVPLRVDPDGSSHFTGEPLRVGPPRETGPAAAPVASAPEADPAPSAAPVQEPSAQPQRDKATHFLRTVPESASTSAPASTPVPEPVKEPVKEPAPTFPLRTVPEPWDDIPASDIRASDIPASDVPAPGTVSAPTGVFGPPPTMDAPPDPEAHRTPDSEPAPVPDPEPAPLLDPKADSGLGLGLDLGLDPDSKPTPARGFDAVAEAVLGDDPRSLPGKDGGPALLGEPMARINEAVRAGRIETAAALAEQTVTEASGTLGPEHPEVLRLRELTAYIAYLAGDPLRSFHLSLDLARIGRRTRDAEAAYGNVQSAAAAWRAVRDPFQGLNLGTELLGLWTELTTEEGPAADDVEQLESARARMTRLAERARNAGAQQRG